MPLEVLGEPVVVVENLGKVFEVPVREAGLRASLKSLLHRETRSVVAVEGVSFRIEPGEVVGFLGPNGAGKTTTLKMLAGLLHPTTGQCSVLGFEPKGRPAGLLRQITLVMGNRNQLQWDLPALDSFELNRAIYRVPRADFVRLRDELIDLLELGTLVDKPVRNLSLGERMKVEIAGSLLHQPKVLFLDEPTIGLDITMQKRIRSFVADYNQRYGATVMLTSHYMADVQALCKRVIVIHHGRILFDGELASLADRFSLDKTVTARLADGEEIKVNAPRGDIAAATGRLLADNDVVDLTIEDAPIEDVIERLFPGTQVIEMPVTGSPGTESKTHAMGSMYLTLMRTSVISQFQYRAATYFYMIGMVVEPIIYLVVWSTIARSHGGEVSGFTPGTFAAYYIVWMLVRNVNIVFTPFGWEFRIKEGDFAAQLLKPMHPIHYDLATFAGGKLVVIVLWLPIAAALSLLFHPSLHPSLLQCVVFFLAIWGAYLIRSLVLWALGLITLWTTRVSALYEAYFLSELLLSGRLVPMQLMPQWAQQLSWAFPFRWTFAFPITSLTGPITERELFEGLAMQALWIAIGTAIVALVWHRGVRRFSSVGG